VHLWPSGRLEYGPLFTDRSFDLIDHRALVIHHRALLIDYRALLIDYWALLIDRRSLLIDRWARLVEYSFFGKIAGLFCLYPQML